MPIVMRSGQSKIFPGAAKVIQKAPPAVTRTQVTRRAAPKEEREIEYLAMAKEVEAAKAEEKKLPRGMARRVHYDSVLAEAAARVKQGADVNDVVTYVQESGLTTKGEAGYVLNTLATKGLEGKLTDKLQTWYDSQIKEMTTVLAQASADAKQRVALLKGRGDYTSSDIQRIYTSEYPKWSEQYKIASKALGKIEAKGGPEAVATEQAGAYARVRAKTAGVDLGDLTDKQIAQLKKALPEEAKKQAKELRLSETQLTVIRKGVKVEEEVSPGTVSTLTGREIPREWRMADSETRETLGVEKVNGVWTQEVITAANGQIVSKKAWLNLPKKYQYIILKEGIDAFHEVIEVEQRNFENWLKELKKDYPDLYKIYEREGYESLVGTIEQRGQQAGILAKLDTYKTEGGYDITQALIDKAITLDDLKSLEFKDSDIKKASDVAKEVLELEQGFLSRSKDSQDLIVRIALTPEPQRSTVLKESKEEKPSWLVDKTYSELTPKEKLQVLEYYETNVKPGALKVTKEYLRVRVEPLIAFTPVLGTIYFWKDMSPTWRAISIATDVVCIGAIVHAAAASARAARGYTAGARMKAAGAGASEMALAEVTAPAEIAAHPIKSIKGVGGQILSAVETIFHPKKVPLGATELSYTTTRLPVKDVGGAAKAMQLRDAAVDAAIHGKRATAAIGDVGLTLTPAELQKVGGSMAIHATPDIRPFLNGAVVKGGAEGSGIFISPNFHSRFAQATAFGNVPEGGVRGGLIIRDPTVLKAISPSGKTYMGTVEIEALLKSGTTLPSPTQVLFTRDIAGNKLTFLVIGDPFTPAQVAKLKFLGSMDTVVQIFKPTMQLTGTQKTVINAMDDIIELSQERATLAGQLNTARSAGRTAIVQELGQRITRIDEKISDLVRRVNAPRESIRPSDIIWAQYTDKGLLERWRELNPREVTKTARGTRLSTIETSRIIRRASRPEEQRRVPPEMRRTPAYSHLYNPSYVPPYVPPYTPSKTPIHPPPSSRAPLRISRAITTKAPAPVQRQPRIGLSSVKLGRERIPRPGQGLVSWRQGMYYVTVVEPYRTTGARPDVIYSRHKPPWARVVKGKHSPQKTLNAIGKRHPRSIKLPMGVVTAHVRNGRRLRFLPN
jgi:hypothetical protein